MGRGRHPVDAVRPAQPLVWEAARRLRSFTVREIADAAGVNPRTASGYLKALEAGGYLASRKDGTAPRRFDLVRDAGVEAPRVRPDGSPATQGDGVERMWRTMKRLKVFTARELAVTASLPERPVAVETAKDYCGWLRRAGYLAAISPGGGGRAAVYRFVLDTGPRPPMIQRVAQVWDPNSREVVYQAGRGRR